MNVNTTQIPNCELTLTWWLA